ncbi:MAG: winged helix-turn-helix domain-containing protein [Spirochaetes bacterium]|nr:winged helix-turn-helix domain-containing protein [Spirochaetota bacterium]
MSEGGSLTRGRLTARITALILQKYPIAWNVPELALATGAGRRTVERVLADLVEAGVIEKKYHSYTLHNRHLNQIFGAKWAVRQEIEKDTMIQKRRAYDQKHDQIEP